MTEEKKQGGQAVLIIAMLLLVIVILIALAVDGGNAWAQHQLAQNAVDAGLLAGIQAMAQEFEQGEVTLLERDLFALITDYTSAGGIPAEHVKAWYTDINGEQLQKVDENGGEPVPKFILDPVGKKHQVNGLEVWGDRYYDTFFIRVVGRDTMVSGAESTGWVWCGVCGGELLFPVAIDTESFTDTDEYPELYRHYVIWDRTMEQPGGFGWVNWGDVGEDPQGTSETSLQLNIDDTHRSGLWNVGDWVPATTGVSYGAKVVEGIARKIYPPDGDPGTLPNYEPETLFIPIYDYACDELPPEDPDYEDWACTEGSNLKYRIVYFIGFKMTCMRFRSGAAGMIGECTHQPWDPDEKWLEGYFVKVVTQLGEGVCPTGSLDVCTYKMRRPSVGP
jgi:hypothetical protein